MGEYLALRRDCFRPLKNLKAKSEGTVSKWLAYTPEQSSGILYNYAEFQHSVS